MGEGERLHAQRRRRFWMILGGLAAVGFVAGLVSGFAAGVNDARNGAADPTLVTLGAAGVILFTLAAAWGSWRFFQNVDEVEVADNLWASLIGFYAYAFLLPAWWTLWKIRQVPEPNDWIIYAVALLTATAAYAYRKWQSR